MESLVRIRPVASTDREAWLGLRSQLWPQYSRDQLTGEVDSHLKGAGLWKLGAETVPFLVLVAEHPGAGLVGFAEIALRPFADGCRTAPVGYLEGWFVHPGHRRQGIGAALVRGAEDWARSRGCQEMASDANLDNLVSDQAHKALGYSEVHRTIHFRRDLA